jgi:hypothetical protein
MAKSAMSSTAAKQQVFLAAGGRGALALTLQALAATALWLRGPAEALRRRQREDLEGALSCFLFPEWGSSGRDGPKQVKLSMSHGRLAAIVVYFWRMARVEMKERREKAAAPDNLAVLDSLVGRTDPERLIGGARRRRVGAQHENQTLDR